MAKAEAKTKPTRASVDAYLAGRGSEEQVADCQVLLAMLERLTRESSVMWGPSIVGFGRYRYTYASGHSGESCRVGLAIRGKELVLYLLAADAEQQARLARLGKHKMGKACLYFKRLADLDLGVLEALVVGSLAELERLYPADKQT